MHRKIRKTVVERIDVGGDQQTVLLHAHSLLSSIWRSVTYVLGKECLVSWHHYCPNYGSILIPPDYIVYVSTARSSGAHIEANRTALRGAIEIRQIAGEVQYSLLFA